MIPKEQLGIMPFKSYIARGTWQVGDEIKIVYNDEYEQEMAVVYNEGCEVDRQFVSL